MSPRDPSFPFEAVRDLLGIARAMYAVETDRTRRAELAEIGSALRTAIERAERLPAESLGGRAAFNRAEDATQRLCALVAGDVLKLVHAAAGRVRRGA
jgi:hypothetical protein